MEPVCTCRGGRSRENGPSAQAISKVYAARPSASRVTAADGVAAVASSVRTSTPATGEMVPDQPAVGVGAELGEQGGAVPEPGQSVRDVGRAAARVDLIGRTRQPDDVGDAFADDQQVESVEHGGGVS